MLLWDELSLELEDDAVPLPALTWWGMMSMGPCQAGLEPHYK